MNSGDQPGADLGPLISPQAKERVCKLVQSGVDDGASVRVIVHSRTSTSVCTVGPLLVCLQ